MRWPLLALAIAAGALCGVASEAAPSRSPSIIAWPGPAPQLRARDKSAGEIAGWNAGCVSCHAPEAMAWQRSRHSRAFENEPFQRALAREPETTRGFCVGCHAPEAEHAGGEAAALGVGCITCHTPLGPVLASSASGKAPHGTFASVDFRSTSTCKRCHEFAFPRHESGGGLMQRTISEHDAADGEATCVSCHMPSGSESHAFPGGYDEALVKRSLVVRAERRGCAAVVTLTPNGVSHAVPSGDLFRRLAVELSPAAGETETRYLARHFIQQNGRRVEASDDRPHLGPRELAFPLSGRCEAPFSYKVWYQRVAFIAGDDEAGATLESQVLLAEGRVTGN